MKLFNLKSSAYLTLLSVLLFSQYVFGGIIRDDDNTPTVTPTVTSYSTFADMSISTSAISVDLVGSEIMVNFDSPVGIATVTVKDKKSNVVYQTTVDTNSTAEVAVPVSGLSKGDYTVTVVYGTSTFVEVVSIP